MQAMTRRLQDQLGRHAHFDFLQGQHPVPRGEVNPAIKKHFGDDVETFDYLKPFFEPAAKEQGYEGEVVDLEKYWEIVHDKCDVHMEYRGVDQVFRSILKKFDSDGPYDCYLASKRALALWKCSQPIGKPVIRILTFRGGSTFAFLATPNATLNFMTRMRKIY